MEESVDLLTEFETISINRRQLIPWWMKVFCRIFLIFGAGVVVCLILRIFGYIGSLAFYGFETNDAFSLIGLSIVAVGIFKAITAFSLLYEKDYAILLGKMDAYIGIFLCVVNMILPYFIENFQASIRLELVLLTPYLIKLNKMETGWKLQ